MIDQAHWLHVLTYCGVRLPTAANWAHLFERHIQADRFSQGLREIDDFVGQVLHETGRLEQLQEGLSYSADRIREIGNKSPPGSRWRSLVPIADQIARKPREFANAAYGGRMGNTEPDDGFRFAAKGCIQVTGKDNYRMLESLTGLPLLEQPELLLVPDTALRCAIVWWEKRVPDATIDNIERVSRAVNGGTIGLSDRREITDKARKALQ